MFNLMKTAILMAAITALFMLLGQMLGGQSGMIGISTFGESAPIGDLLPEFGFTVDHVVAKANEVLGVKGKKPKKSSKK